MFTIPTTGRRPVLPGPVESALVLIAAGGLALDAYVHADLAARFDLNTADVSQGTLFRVDAALAVLAALLVLLVRHWTARAFAALVAGAGLGAILLYRYVDVGTLGPLPNMYEPVWYPDKTWSVVGAGCALAAALALLALSWTGRRRGAHR